MAISQNVYKTPSGNCYHTEYCSSIENTSTIITLEDAVTKFSLKPCKRCNPPVNYNYQLNFSKAKNNTEYNCKSQQCRGTAKTTKQRCKSKTKNCNGYCARHNPDNAGKANKVNQPENRYGKVKKKSKY